MTTDLLQQPIAWEEFTWDTPIKPLFYELGFITPREDSKLLPATNEGLRTFYEQAAEGAYEGKGPAAKLVRASSTQQGINEETLRTVNLYLRRRGILTTEHCFAALPDITTKLKPETPIEIAELTTKKIRRRILVYVLGTEEVEGKHYLSFGEGVFENGLVEEALQERANNILNYRTLDVLTL